MGFEIRSDGVDTERILGAIRETIAERRARGIVTDEEVRAIAERALEGVLVPGDVPTRLLDEFRERDARWNYVFERDTLYRSSRGLAGRALETVRSLLRPAQKLFWNPNPMIAALSRQADLNRYSVHLLHNLAVELTRLNLEVSELKSRNLQLGERIELLARRERTLESMVRYREGQDGGEGPGHEG